MYYSIDLSRRQLQTRRMRNYAFWVAIMALFTLSLYGWVMALVRNV